METQHLFEDRIYAISNASGAKNCLFKSREDIKYFQEKLDHQLSSICNLIAYSFKADEYVLLIRLKSREEIADFYRKKKGRGLMLDDLIPPSSYIFSQQMANLQAGYAKHYNWKYKRSGSLFCSRFARELIESEEEMIMWVDKINNLYEFRARLDYWKSDRYKALVKVGVKWKERMLNCSFGAYARGEQSGMACFSLWTKIDLQGCFSTPMKKVLDDATIRKFFMNSLKFVISLV